MPDSKTVKLLLVEDDPKDEQLLFEALLEIEEDRLWCNWRTSSIVPVDRLADAVDCLQRHSFDAILLNLSLPDSPALLDSFLSIGASAPNVPIVVLADQPDENLANRLLREGAQEVLLKSELECVPLARAIRYAIERQRRTNAARASAFVDQLTGALTRAAFLHIAAHLDHTGWLALIEITADREALDPLLIQAAAFLSAAFQPPSVVGRCDRDRFCVITVSLAEAAVESTLYRVANRIAGFHFSLRPLDSKHNLEEILEDTLHPRAKTAILAD